MHMGLLKNDTPKSTADPVSFHMEVSEVSHGVPRFIIHVHTGWAPPVMFVGL